MEIRDKISAQAESEQLAQKGSTVNGRPSAKIRFSPVVVTLPSDKDGILNCYLEFDEDHDVSEIDLDSLQLIGPGGTIKPDTSLCFFEDLNKDLITELRISFPTEDVGKLFIDGFRKVLFTSLELSGQMNNGTPFSGTSVIQVKRKES